MQPKYQFTMILLIYVRRKDSSDGRAYDFLPSFLLCHSLEGTKIGVGSRLNPGNTAHGHFWASVRLLDLCTSIFQKIPPSTFISASTFSDLATFAPPPRLFQPPRLLKR